MGREREKGREGGEQGRERLREIGGGGGGGWEGEREREERYSHSREKEDSSCVHLICYFGACAVYTYTHFYTLYTVQSIPGIMFGYPKPYLCTQRTEVLYTSL